MKIIKLIYNTIIRDHLPGKIAILNGVGVRYVALFDFSDINKEYKQTMGRFIRENVKETDNVVEIGGGRGVLSIIAARTGANVDTYEAAEEMIKKITHTVENNPTRGTIRIHHGLVGEGKNVYGNASAATTVRIDDLPEHDVLIMDCEGAEVSILEDYVGDARILIIESHPNLEASVERIKSKLDEIGYEIKNAEPQSPTSQRPVLLCVKNGSSY